LIHKVIFFKDPECDPEQLVEAVKLLQQLGNSSDVLINSFLAHQAVQLTGFLQQLMKQIDIVKNPSKVSICVLIICFIFLYLSL
jgi:hypothetical protein